MARSLKRVTPPPAPEAHSRDDTGVILNIHPRSVDRLVKKGELDAIRLGSRVVITRQSINRRLGLGK
jgi:hypothetical protein